MPKPPPSKGRPFPKGKSGNPDGSSAGRRVTAAMARMMPALAKSAPHMTPEGVRVMVAGILAGSVGEVRDLQKELGDDLCVAYASLVTALQVASKKGDVGSILRAVEFVHGRMPERLEVTGRDGGPIKTDAMRSVPELEAELAAIRARKKEARHD